MAPQIRTARVRDLLDTPAGADELRVLVDRLWPRGVRKDRLVDVRWERDVAPSDALRRAYHEGALDHAAFAERYRAELEASGAAAALLARAQEAGARTLTLLSDAREVESSHVPVLSRALAEA